MSNLAVLSLLPVMVGTLLAGILLPVLAIVVWRRKTRARFAPILVGAVTFFVAVQVLESSLHALLLYGIAPIAGFFAAHPVAFGVYGALAAGVFEESGRYLAFRFALKNHNDPETAVSYGIGHGGFECFMVLAVNYIVYIAVMLTGGPALEQIAPVLATVTPGLCAVAVAERAVAMVFHICASVWVFAAVHDPAKRHYYPLAILFHALMDFPAMLYQRGLLSMVAVELLLLAYAAAFALYTRRLYGQLPRML